MKVLQDETEQAEVPKDESKQEGRGEGGCSHNGPTGRASFILHRRRARLGEVKVLPSTLRSQVTCTHGPAPLGPQLGVCPQKRSGKQQPLPRTGIRQGSQEKPQQ